jgi:hypothetical protein
MFSHGDEPWLKMVLNKYENMRIGTADHRHGMVDPYEQQKLEDGESVQTLPPLEHDLQACKEREMLQTMKT